VAFGMGGGLLQKLDRDTMSFATKLSHVVYADGTPGDSMKNPAGDSAKISFPGELVSTCTFLCAETLAHFPHELRQSFLASSYVIYST